MVRVQNTKYACKMKIYKYNNSITDIIFNK